jgi:hypothetical protein
MNFNNNLENPQNTTPPESVESKLDEQLPVNEVLEKNEESPKSKSWWDKFSDGVVQGMMSSKFMKTLALATMLGPAAQVATAQTTAPNGQKIETKIGMREDGPVKKLSDIADYKVLGVGEKMNPAIHKKYMSEISPGVFHFREQAQDIYEAFTGYELSTKAEIENYFTKVCEVYHQSKEHIVGLNSAIDLSDKEGKPGIVITAEEAEWGSEVLYRLVDKNGKYVLTEINGQVYDVFAKDNHDDGKLTDCVNFFVRKHQEKEVIPPVVTEVKHDTIYIDRIVEVPGKTDTVRLTRTRVVHDVEQVPVFVPVPVPVGRQPVAHQEYPPHYPPQEEPPQVDEPYHGGSEPGNPGDGGYHGGSNEPGNPGDGGYHGGSNEPGNPGGNAYGGGDGEPQNPRGVRGANQNQYTGGGKVKAPSLNTPRTQTAKPVRQVQEPQRQRIVDRVQRIKPAPMAPRNNAPRKAPPIKGSRYKKP